MDRSSDSVDLKFKDKAKARIVSYLFEGDCNWGKEWREPSRKREAFYSLGGTYICKNSLSSRFRIGAPYIPQCMCFVIYFLKAMKEYHYNCFFNKCVSLKFPKVLGGLMPHSPLLSGLWNVWRRNRMTARLECFAEAPRGTRGSLIVPVA